MGGIIGEWKPSTLHLILFAVGGGLVYLGQEWAVPWASDFGIGTLGVLMIAAGTDVIIKKMGVFRIEGWTRVEVVETYRGLAEMLWGFVFLCIGLVMLSVVVMGWLAPASAGAFWADLLSSPTGIGVILTAAGALMLINGLIRALAGSGRADPRRLGGVPYALDRVVGAAASLLGVLVSAIGLVLLTAPGVVTGALDAMKGLVSGP
jgi:hypothetical protein